MVEINGIGCFIYENDGLDVLSFKNLSDFMLVYADEKLKFKQYGSIADWDKFLQQFTNF